jgi:hypothetical protein
VVEHLKGLASLTSLGIGCKQITDAWLENQKRLTSLEDLSLTGDGVAARVC